VIEALVLDCANGGDTA